jgi:hypothetical protein|tara:strand:- start:76 stop:435 length:360 start_codon:yes stop_codon:yes gene_type:complete
MTQESQAIGALVYPETITGKPCTRADCASVPRPCPYVSCQHHLYLDVSKYGSILHNFPDLEPWDMPARESCALDVVEDNPDGLTMDATGRLVGLTRARVEQMEWAYADRLRPLLDEGGS